MLYYFRFHSEIEWHKLVSEEALTWRHLRAAIAAHVGATQLALNQSSGQFRRELVGQAGMTFDRDKPCFGEEDVVPPYSHVTIASRMTSSLPERHPYALTEDERLAEEILIRPLQASLPYLWNPMCLPLLLRMPVFNRRALALCRRLPSSSARKEKEIQTPLKTRYPLLKRQGQRKNQGKSQGPKRS